MKLALFGFAFLLLTPKREPIWRYLRPRTLARVGRVVVARLNAHDREQRAAAFRARHHLKPHVKRRAG